VVCDVTALATCSIVLHSCAMENLPIDVVLVRHGESEGNLAQSLSKKGDDSMWTPEFCARHTSLYRLTDRGRKQAVIAADYIKKNIFTTFDNYYVSEYIRAQETAALLNFKESKWHCEFYLREQDKGILGGKSQSQRATDYAHLLASLKKDSFYIAPPGGESTANSCLRVDRIISAWQHSCPGQKIIAVCHGNIMMAFRVRLEGISQSRFQELMESKHHFDKIHHCQIFHYTRRNPWTSEIATLPSWMRSICPWDTTRSSNMWQEIVRSTYSNEDLLFEVNRIPQLVNNPEDADGKEEEDFSVVI